MNSNKKIYWILGLLTLGSYGWIGYHLLHTESQGASSTLCLFKNVTGIPCPSCGVTRSIMLLLQGDLMEALQMNPIGILAALLLFTIPLWIIADWAMGKTTLLFVYSRSEEIIRQQKSIYIPLIALVAINWIWNITKGL